MVPLLSAAVALMVMLAGEVNVALFAGELIETVGAGLLTVTLIALEVETAPSLSIALAVITYPPAATFVQAKL